MGYAKCVFAAAVIFFHVTIGLARVMQADWTILVYLNADNNLDKSSLLNFQQMACIGSSNKVNIVVQYDRKQPMDLIKESDSNWWLTRRFYITRGTPPLASSALPTPAVELDMCKPETLRDFIVWGLNTFPARHTMLVLWSHGTGWTSARLRDAAHRAGGFFSETDINKLTSLADGFGYDSCDAMPDCCVNPTGCMEDSLNLSLTWIGPDESSGSGSKLELSQIRLACQDALSQTGYSKFDVLASDTCFMGGVEVCYEFKDIASYAVVSEGIMPDDGLPYHYWLGQLRNAPYMSPRELSCIMIGALSKYYSSKPYNRQPISVSAVDLHKMRYLGSCLNHTALSLIRMGHTPDFERVVRARLQCHPFNVASFVQAASVDLQAMLRILSKQLPVESAAQLSCKATLKAVRQCVVANYTNSCMKTATNASGLSIYFPACVRSAASDGSFKCYENSTENCRMQFTEETSWDDFLSQYLAHSP